MSHSPATIEAELNDLRDTGPRPVNDACDAPARRGIEIRSLVFW